MNKKSIDDFLIKAKKAHGDLYDYSKVKYIKSTLKVTIICRIHGEFEQTPSAHYQGQRCPACARDSRISLISNTTQSFIEKANKIHFNKYDYSQVNYKNGEDKVIIICQKHGPFIQTAKDHLIGHGCVNCRRSKGEEIIERLLIYNKISFIPQKLFDDCKGKKNKLPFDFYLPDISAVIEFQGEQHFVPVKHWGGDEKLRETQVTDNIKKEYCKTKGMVLFEITYKDKIQETLEKHLGKKLEPL
jgi:hypothetical protein